MFILIELSDTSVQNNGVDLAKFPIILCGGEKYLFKEVLTSEVFNFLVFFKVEVTLK
jgi:hypothetical protein